MISQVRNCYLHEIVFVLHWITPFCFVCIRSIKVTFRDCIFEKSVTVTVYINMSLTLILMGVIHPPSIQTQITRHPMSSSRPGYWRVTLTIPCDNSLRVRTHKKIYRNSIIHRVIDHLMFIFYSPKSVYFFVGDISFQFLHEAKPRKWVLVISRNTQLKIN